MRLNIVRLSKHKKANYSQMTAYRPCKAIHKKYWCFHIGDDDPFPSVPHGHSTDNKYKLSIWDGYVYLIKTGEIVGKVKRSELLFLESDHKFQDFIKRSRSWFSESHSFLPPLKPLETEALRHPQRLIIRRCNNRIKYQTNSVFVALSFSAITVEHDN